MALSSVLRKISQTITRAQREPMRQPGRPAPRADGFDTRQLGRVSPRAAKLERDRAFVTSLYQDLLGREPDVEGMASHMRGLQHGMSHEDIRQVFLTSPEYQQLQAERSRPAPTPPAEPTPPPPTEPTTPLPREPGAPLQTVPMRAEYASAPIDRSSDAAAAKSAAAWVKQNHPEFFNQGDDRRVAFEMMTNVIGALRAAGYDAHRVVNHPSHPMGSGPRYGSDAVVINGQIYDVYAAWGDPGRSEPVAQNVGPYAPGRLRE